MPDVLHSPAPPASAASAADDDEAREGGAAQSEIEREATLAVEPLSDRGRNGGDAGRVPAGRHDDVEHDELPGLGDRRQQEQGGRGGGEAGQEHGARPEAADRFGDAREQHGAQQIVRGNDRRDEAGRPAAGALQFDEVDAVGIEAEAPGEHGRHEAGEDDAPGGRRRVRSRVQRHDVPAITNG